MRSSGPAACHPTSIPGPESHPPALAVHLEVCRENPRPCNSGALCQAVNEQKLLKISPRGQHFTSSHFLPPRRLGAALRTLSPSRTTWRDWQDGKRSCSPGSPTTTQVEVNHFVICSHTSSLLVSPESGKRTPKAPPESQIWILPRKEAGLEGRHRVSAPVKRINSCFRKRGSRRTPLQSGEMGC